MGQKYKPGCMTLIGIDDEYPSFAEILNIYIADSKIYFEVITYMTISFNKHFNAYEVERTTRKELIYNDNLLIPYTEIIKCCNHKNFVMLRHYVPGIV